MIENIKHAYIEEYETILNLLYRNIYGEDIKEVPLSSGEYIIANRTELGLIYQKLATFEENFELIKNNIIEEANKEADKIIQEAKLKVFKIIDNNMNTRDKEIELVRDMKDLASENAMYLHKKIKKETESYIDSLININKQIQLSINNLEDYSNMRG